MPFPLVRSPYTFVVLILLSGAAYWTLDYRKTELAALPSFDPRTTPYTGSTQCGTCHAGRYESWHRTYHRTMTAPAVPANMRAPIDSVVDLKFYGYDVRFEKSNNSYTVQLPGPDGNYRRFPILYTIGSRRMQQFAIQDEDKIYRIPVFYSIQEKRWMHINDAFFRRKTQGIQAFVQGYGIWNPNCIFCHNTRPDPGWDAGTKTFHSSVAETGIACEECHAPGAIHAAANRNPLRRYLYEYRDAGDPTIVHPLKIDALRSVQICGQCHGQRLPNPLDRIQDIVSNGDPYAAGQDLFAFYKPVAMTDRVGQFNQFYLRFWKDGTPRLTAFELQALIASQCFLKSKNLTCLTCHSAHGGDPKGMIEPKMRTDAACTQCHDQYAGDAASAKHSGHKTGTTSCYSCHMPEMVYGVMTLHPSHLIRNPDPGSTIVHNMPNACNLCHLDRSVNWSVAQYNRMWNKSLAAGESNFDIPEIVRGFATGDAVYRAVLLESARTTKLKGFDAILLAGLSDPFYSVSHFADRSLSAEYGKTFPDPSQWISFLGTVAPVPEFDKLRKEQAPEEPFDFGE